MSLKKIFKKNELTKILLSEMATRDEEIFILSPQEYNKYDRMMKDFGTDISYITVEDMNEAKPSIVGMKDTDRFDKNFAIKINKGVHNRLREMISEGIEAKNWYYQISNAIYDSLGQSDGVLFLMLLASTSPRNMLTKNFVEASILFKGFHDDLKDNEQLLVNFLNDDAGADMFSYEEDDMYGELKLVTAMRNDNTSDVGAKINNIKKSLRFYYTNGGNVNKTMATEFLSKHFNPYSSTVTGIIDFSGGDILQRSKVYNFVINLLAPEYSVMIQNKKWFFVTIDTWMIRAMYPYLDDKVQNTIMSHNAKYLYAQQKIMQFAKEFNMEPHQVQASIWVAKLKEEGRSVDSFETSIMKKVGELKSGNSITSDIFKNLGEVINDIYVDNMKKPSGLKPKKIDVGGGNMVDLDVDAPF